MAICIGADSERPMPRPTADVVQLDDLDKPCYPTPVVLSTTILSNVYAYMEFTGH
jgi:hypothetical protein